MNASPAAAAPPPADSAWLYVAGAMPAFAFVGGATALQQLASLPAPAALFAALAFAVAAVAAAFCFTDRLQTSAGATRCDKVRQGAAIPKFLPVYGGRARLWRFVAVWALMFVLGFCYAAARAHYRLYHSALPPQLVWQDITVEGRVVGEPRESDGRTSFDFLITLYQGKDEPPVAVNLRARLSDYHRGGAPPHAAIVAGAPLRFVARLRPPAGSFNPGGFDYAKQMFVKNIRLVGYVRGKGAGRALALGAPTEDFRRRLAARIGASGAPQAAIIQALVVGERRNFDDETWRVFRRTGTAHLISISGAHIGFVYFLAAALAWLLWRASPRLSAKMPAARAALLLALPAAAAYAWLAGLGVPVQRSLFTLAVAAGVLLAGGAFSPVAALALAMFAVVLANPWAPLTAGFWLSFLFAAALLFIAAARAGGRWRAAKRLVLAQLFMSLLAAPLTLWFFNQASFVSPLANLLAIPVVGFAVLPLALGGVFLGDWCWHLAGQLLAWLWIPLQFLADLSWAAWSPAQAPGWLFAAAVGGGVWLLMPRGAPLRACGLLPICAMLLYAPAAPAHGEAKLVFFDVGQGAAAAVFTQNHAMVFDVGKRRGGGIVADYLRAAGVKKLDALMLSHDDNDHSGGREALLQQTTAATVYASDATPCLAGQSWRWDGVLFEVLHPPPPAPKRYGNDDSCVLLAVNAAGRAALFVGDISAATEREILARLGERAPRLAVLQVAHHGSGTSSSAEFLAALRPQVAVVPVGRNVYGHPHGEVLQRLRAVGATVYRTDANGATEARLGREVAVFSWRERLRRYWHGEAAQGL